jgi:hypothetical protein
MSFEGYDPEVDETVRLVLMEHPEFGFSDFMHAVREYAHVSIIEGKYYYERYRGWDGRVPATHDLETGRRL